MTASARDRAHTHQVELAMENGAAGRDIRDVAAGLAITDRRISTFLRALVDAHTEAAALHALIAARAAHVIDVSSELAGLLEVGEPEMFRKPVNA